MSFKWIPVLALSALVAACGGGGGDDAAVTGGGGAGGASSAAPLAAGEALTGYFIDAPVFGLSWSTRQDGIPTGRSGTTGFNGQFPFNVGETVTFSVGGLVLGSAPATAVMTPLTLAGTTDSNNQIVINMARLLQSLDTDGNPDNGITLENVPDLSGVVLDQDPATFTAPVTPLVSAEAAKEHLDLSLEAVRPGTFATRLTSVGNWRIFGSAQGADGQITFTRTNELGGTLVLTEVNSCADGARANVVGLCDNSVLTGGWYYDPDRREVVLRINELGEDVTDRCQVLQNKAGLIELLCREVLSDGTLGGEEGPAYLVRDEEDIIGRSTAPSAASVSLYYNLNVFTLEDGAGTQGSLDLGSGVFRFNVAGAPIADSEVYNMNYDVDTATLTYSTTPIVSPSLNQQGTFTQVDPAPEALVTCTLYNGMELEGNGNRAFYANCDDVQGRQIWILSPNNP